MDTMTITKAVASICGAWLILLMGAWAAESIYHVGGHGDQAYVIDTGEEEGAGEAEETVDFATVLAEADAGKGERVFRKCQACHKLGEGENGTGPTLHNVVGRPIASEAGFNYSDALASLEGDWTPEHLEEFLHKPSGYAPGTAMSFAGLPKIEDRADVIAYLQSAGG